MSLGLNLGSIWECIVSEGVQMAKYGLQFIMNCLHYYVIPSILKAVMDF